MPRDVGAQDDPFDAMCFAIKENVYSKVKEVVEVVLGVGCSKKNEGKKQLEWLFDNKNKKQQQQQQQQQLTRGKVVRGGVDEHLVVFLEVHGVGRSKIGHDILALHAKRQWQLPAHEKHPIGWLQRRSKVSLHHLIFFFCFHSKLTLNIPER